MKRGALIITAVILLTGCGGRMLSTKSTCLPNAIYTAIVIQQKTHYETRLVLMHSDRLNKGHAQTQVKVDGRWMWADLDFVPQVIIDSGPDIGQRSSDDWKVVRYIPLSAAYRYVRYTDTEGR